MASIQDLMHQLVVVAVVAAAAVAVELVIVVVALSVSAVSPLFYSIKKIFFAVMKTVYKLYFCYD